MRCIIALLLIAMTMGCQAPNQLPPSEKGGKGALLLSEFHSFEELKEVIDIEYGRFVGTTNPPVLNAYVRLRHRSAGREIRSVLRAGMSEKDFKQANKGNFWEKLWLLINTPYGILQRKDLQRVYALSKRRGAAFGEGDVAFFDLAQEMMLHISEMDRKDLSSAELSEKGYINTFNHLTAQAFVTSIFSEKLADYIADTHERANMPELITGDFTQEQIEDLETGPTDNYVDIINNEWGQELGRQLRKKYKIRRGTQWTPELLRDYLNDVQSYYSWSFDLAFEPFRAKDEVVYRFAEKINTVLGSVPKIE